MLVCTDIQSVASIKDHENWCWWTCVITSWLMSMLLKEEIIVYFI